MPDETKKNQHKGPKDQRRPRNRHQAGPAEKKVDRKAEEPKVSVPQKPVYEEPGPEFYKSLKRETDDILKITEEANSKYKKKEIQSNWSKYEMPIESYDEIEEQENMGADYEKLIEAPLSIGGHFQFKHEKSWDVDTGPSLYDKYFEVNMDDVFLAISTIPFYERIDVDKSFFSETDILTMNNRATRFKQKYYKDKSFTTPELSVQDNILRSLKEKTADEIEQNHVEDIIETHKEDQGVNEYIQDTRIYDIGLENINVDNNITTTGGIASKSKKSIPETKLTNEKSDEDLVEFENLILDTNNKEKESSKLEKPNEELTKDLNNFKDLIDNKNKAPELEKYTTVVIEETKKAVTADTPIQPEQPQKNPVIESPEDLEKWLDDFLDD